MVWDDADISCGGEIAAAESDTATLHSGSSGDSGQSFAAGTSIIKLAPGCSLPVTVTAVGTELGDLWGSLVVRTTYAGLQTGDKARDYGRDQSDWTQQVYLQALVDVGGRLVLDPSVLEFGEAALGVEQQGDIAITNRGTSPLTISDVSLAADCAAEFALVSGPSTGTVLAPRESVAFEVSFIASQTEYRACRVAITSDDAEGAVAYAVFTAYSPPDSGEESVDDDFDGYTEVEGDCDDGDPSHSPGVVEQCNGVDDDCDGLKDGADGCIETDTEPIIVGLIEAKPDGCHEGEIVDLSVVIFDPDGDSYTSTWGDDRNTRGFESTSEVAATWECPSIEGDDPGPSYSVYVLVTDIDGRQTWSTVNIADYSDEVSNFDYDCVATE